MLPTAGQRCCSAVAACRSIEVDEEATETFVTEDGAVVEAVDAEEAEVGEPGLDCFRTGCGQPQFVERAINAPATYSFHPAHP